MAYLDETGLKEVWSKMKDKMYPVGSIYMSVNSTNPSTIYGGTWEQIKDTFLLACGDTYTAGSTGGEATHTLTENEIPVHHHYTTSYQNGYPASVTDADKFITLVNVKQTKPGQIIDNSQGAAGTSTTDYGGGVAHNNMPPYLAVYVWKRTA